MEYCSLMSGSWGNCHYVRAGGTSILIDAGQSGKRILGNMEMAGCGPASSLSAILVTHAHGDHVHSAGILARRFGLVATMVGTHLPSNLLLAAVAFAPAFAPAAVLLLARTTLSQMDVPTRQALVMNVVAPGERTAAAAVTNAARYTVRPIGPLVAGLVQQLALGAPLVVAGVVKAGYDMTLWGWAQHAGLTSRNSRRRPGPESGTAMTASPGESP